MRRSGFLAGMMLIVLLAAFTFSCEKRPGTTIRYSGENVYRGGLPANHRWTGQRAAEGEHGYWSTAPVPGARGYGAWPTSGIDQYGIGGIPGTTPSDTSSAPGVSGTPLAVPGASGD